MLNIIEPKLEKAFERKKVHGKRLTSCPPLRTTDEDTFSDLELPEYKIPSDSEYDNIQEENIIF